jgi:hypothetical protein
MAFLTEDEATAPSATPYPTWAPAIAALVRFAMRFIAASTAEREAGRGRIGR